MKKLLKVARREYLERVKKKSFLIGTILGPILMGGMILVPGLIFRYSPERQEHIAIVDLSQSLYDGLEEALVDTLEGGVMKFELREVRASGGELDEVKKRLNAEVETDIIDGYLVVPEDIIDNGKATFYGKRVGNIKGISRIQGALSNVVIAHRLAGAGMDYDEVTGMVKRVDLDTKMLKEGKEKEGEFDLLYISSFIFIMMLYMTILLWGVAVQRSIIEEKNNRVIEVLLSSLRASDLLGGKILGVGSVGLTQYAIWAVFAVALSMYGMKIGGFSQLSVFSMTTLVFFIIYYLLGFLFYATLFASIGSVCNSDQEAQQLQTPVVMCLVFTIIIPMAIIQNPDGVFATIVSLIPFFAPIVMFMRINVLTPPAWQIALSIAILIVSIFIAGKLAAKIFRVGILMYGKRPSLPEIIKWLRRA
ncbi:MAG TPA: ABC transporter permease [Patescibacteria group bacterium]|nr:ABC transporter permease [Patescibacteria group bacterium]